MISLETDVSVTQSLPVGLAKEIQFYIFIIRAISGNRENRVEEKVLRVNQKVKST